MSDTADRSVTAPPATREREREPMLSCRGLWKVFGPNPQRLIDSDDARLPRQEMVEKTGCVAAVRDVSFDVHHGEIFVVMGLSGSGKSTLIRCLSRLIEPTAGSVTIADAPVLDADAAALRDIRRNKVSMVFQGFGLLPNRSVRDNVAYGLEIQGMGRKERYAKAEEVIELVGLGGFASSRPDELSGGMKQRVGLARALANDPEVLLLDEPFSALDPLIRREMQAEVVRLQRQMDKTMVFITHDLREALQLGDRIGVMRDGDMVQIGTRLELLDHPADDYVRDFTADVPRARVLTAGDVAVAPVPDGDVPEVHASTVLHELIPHLAAGDWQLRVVDEGRALGGLSRQQILSAMFGSAL
jgi:glycine betaine/proline transport system ATP-binding protein